MSKFFGASSESESDVDSGSSSDSDPEPEQQKGRTKPAAFVFSDDEEDTKRVVRTQKDKRFDEMQTIIKQMKNHKKIRDMAKVLEDFEELDRAYQKSRKVIESEGFPRFVVRCLVDLEDFIGQIWDDKDARKKMSKINSKGLATIRQRIRKHNREPPFEAEIAKYRENPDAAGEAEEEEDDQDSEEDDDEFGGDSKEATPIESEKQARAEDSDEDDWGSETESESESSSSDDDEDDPAKRALKFLKREPTKEEKEKKKAKDEERTKKREERKKKEDSQDGPEWTVVPGANVVPSVEQEEIFKKDEEINVKNVCKKLFDMTSARGKRGTDRSDQITRLQRLHKIAMGNNLGPAMDAKCLFAIISAMFDSSYKISEAMKSEMWGRLLDTIERTLDLLQQHLDPDEPPLVTGEHIPDDSESLETAPYRVRGCILAVVERTEEEYNKVLQSLDAHSTDYVDRLKDEPRVCQIIIRTQDYLEKNPDERPSSEICRIYMKRIDTIYFKHDRGILKTAIPNLKSEGDLTEEKEGGGEEKSVVEDSIELMERFCKTIYEKDTTDRIRTKAMLCHIYHLALHDQWYRARDLMLMSHLQDNIQHADIPIQILYNRTMVQLGLCAFRHGSIKDAHHALLDIQSGGRAKELLAQGLLMQRGFERTPEQEKVERQRQIPFHMHINLELMECIYLVSAMLLEIPYMAAHEFDMRRRLISKSYHYQLRLSERQALVGPPETMREHVVAASKAMKRGDWKACRDFIINDKMNGKVWNLMPQSTEIFSMIARKIQEETLRTYLFTFSCVYDSISLDSLATTFELDVPSVHSIVSKMIISEELMASLDEPTRTVVMHRTEPSHLQSLALQLSEKFSTLVDHNERIMEIRQGTFFSYQKKNQGEGGGGYRGRGGGYRGRGGGGNYRGRGGGEGGEGGGYRGRGGSGYRGGGGRGGDGGEDGEGGGYRGGYGGGGGYRGGRGNYNNDRNQGEGGGYRGGYGGGGGGGGYRGGGGGGGYRGGGGGGGGYRGGRGSYNDRNQGSYQGGYGRGRAPVADEK